MTRRAGVVSLPELILALLFFAVLLAGAGEFLVRSTRLASGQRGDLRSMELARAIRVILGGELRAIALTDLAAASPDSLRIRAFRGGGPVCGGGGAEIWIRYRGSRAPDPAKDSVVLIAATGSEHIRAVEGLSATPCGEGSLSMVFDQPPVAPPVYALLFEAGAYHLADGALRYRRGAGGRQPLTESLLLGPTFTRSDGLSFRVQIRPNPDSLREATLRDREFSFVGLNGRRSP